jgi:DNA-binding transcriptional LysR family regulator
MSGVEIRRLKLLLTLSRLGSMRATADALGYTTSTVSQQLAVLSREAGATLIEREGRRVRLTPAGRRLAEHAATIVAAVEAARADLDPSAEPAGIVRVASFASAIRRTLLPIVTQLAAERADVGLRIHEHEPPEALPLLAADQVDLALVYDYDLAPASLASPFQPMPLWSVAWGLGVPDGRQSPATEDAPSVFRRFSKAAWIVNSRSSADEQVVRLVASLADFEPEIAHRADSLELVEDFIVAGLGVGLLPVNRRPAEGVRLLPLRNPEVILRSYAVTRRGRENWPPLALVTRLVTAHDEPNTPHAGSSTV